MENNFEKIQSPENINDQIRTEEQKKLEQSKFLNKIREKVGSFGENMGVNWTTAEECDVFLENNNEVDKFKVWDEEKKIYQEIKEKLGQEIVNARSATPHLSRTWFEHKLIGSTPNPKLFLYPDKKVIDFYTPEGLKIKIKDILEKPEKLAGEREDIFKFYITSDYNNLIFLKENNLIPEEMLEGVNNYLKKIGQYFN